MSDKETDENAAVLGEKKEMVDITALIEAAASQLSVTEPMLYREGAFNLQDSMAALEIMDKKMDCCEIPASQVAPHGVTASDDLMVFPRPPPTGLDDVIEPLPWKDLTLNDAAYIALECMVRLESLLSGASVVESTFTCLYAHRPVMVDMKAQLEPSSLTEQMQAIMKPKRKGTLPQQIVYASTLMLLELTDMIRSIILNADIYEEEDFTVSTYNIVVFNDRDETTAINAVSDVLELLAGAEDQNPDEVQALQLILGYQVDLSTTCSALAKLSGTKVRNVLESTQKIARVAAGKVEKLLVLLEKMMENQTDSSKALIRKTFDSNVNRPLVGNAPVRKVVFKETKDSISLLCTVTKEIDWALCGVMLKGNSLGRIHRMLGIISVSSVNILSRSLLVLNLYFDDKLFGQYALIEMIVKHIQQLSHVPDKLFASKFSQAFLNRLAKPIYDILKVLILNRNRQRAYIEAVMLHDWASLRQEAHIADLTFSKEFGASAEQQPHFSLYILYITIGLMDHFVNLGIELKLFHGENELAVAYWYRDFLLSSLLSQLSTMRRAKATAKQVALAKAEANTRQQKGKKKGGKHKKNNTNGNTQVQPPSAEDLEYEFEFLLLNLERTLCRGLVRFLAAIKQAGFVKSKTYEFTSDARVFEKRFEAFSPIQQPPPLQYGDYVQGSDFSKVSQNDLLNSTSECFNASKTLVDKLLAQVPSLDCDYLAIRKEELGKLAKVCIGNSVYLQKLKQKVGSSDGGNANAKIDIDLETQNWFCTIKIN